MISLTLYGTTFSDDEVKQLSQTGMGLEVAQYMAPDSMDDFDRVRRQVDAYIKGAKRLSMHAVYCDMNYSSPDKLIVEVVKKRFAQSCAIAVSHGIGRIVFHSSCSKFDFMSEAKTERWVKESAAFWTEFCHAHNELLILIENVADQNPAVFAQMLTEIKADNVGCCFDVGHAFVNSPAVLSEWIDCLGARIRHVHLHDNGGMRDEHGALGTGAIPLTQTLEQLAGVVEKGTPFVLECPATPSLAWLRKEGVFTHGA